MGTHISPTTVFLTDDATSEEHERTISSRTRVSVLRRIRNRYTSANTNCCFSNPFQAHVRVDKSARPGALKLLLLVTRKVNSRLSYPPPVFGVVVTTHPQLYLQRLHFQILQTFTMSLPQYSSLSPSGRHFYPTKLTSVRVLPLYSALPHGYALATISTITIVVA